MLAKAPLKENILIRMKITNIRASPLNDTERNNNRDKPARDAILELIPNRRYFLLKVLFCRKGEKNSWAKLEPPSIMAVNTPICIELPPESINIDGITVSTSMKFFARAKKTA
jgi:hypothetical protein